MKQFFECVREAPQKIYVLLIPVYYFPHFNRISFNLFLSPLLQQKFFVIHPQCSPFCQVYIVPLVLVCVVCSKQFLQVLCDYLPSVHNPYIFLQSLYPIVDPWYFSCRCSKSPVRPIESLFILTFFYHNRQFLLRSSGFCTLKCHVL